MTKLISTVLAGAFLMTLAAPVQAATQKAGFNVDLGQSLIEKRRKPRIPGGSGCDDPRDVIEHPECAG